MRMSELSLRTGVPIPTIKFYLRERLLPEGVKSSPNQAHYDDGHVQRLRLIRALVDVGGLPLGAVRDVLDNIDRPPATFDLLGIAHQAVAPTPRNDADRAAAVDLLRRLGWTACLDDADDVHGDAAIAALATALQALDDAGFAVRPELLDRYGTAAMDIARAEIAGIPTESAAATVRYVILGTVLIEPLLLALRRLAQRQASAARFPPNEQSDPDAG